MIRINLLPPELQRATQTPKSVLYLGAAGLLLVLSIGVVYLYLWLNLLVLRQEQNDLERKVAQLERQAQERDALLEDLKDYKERERSIVQIKTNRILWSRKLDYLVRLTPDEIWITRLKVSKSEDGTIGSGRRKKDTPGFLELQCYALGANVATMTEFRRRLMGEQAFWKYFLTEPIAPNDFSYGFASISQPSWDTVKLEGFREENNIRFTIRFELERRNARNAKDNKAKTG